MAAMFYYTLHTTQTSSMTGSHCALNIRAEMYPTDSRSSYITILSFQACICVVPATQTLYHEGLHNGLANGYVTQLIRHMLPHHMSLACSKVVAGQMEPGLGHLGAQLCVMKCSGCVELRSSAAEPAEGQRAST